MVSVLSTNCLVKRVLKQSQQWEQTRREEDAIPTVFSFSDTLISLDVRTGPAWFTSITHNQLYQQRTCFGGRSAANKRSFQHQSSTEMWATWEQGLSLFARRIDLGTQVINEYWWKGGGERRSNRTLQRSQKGPSRRQGVLLLEILLTQVRHPMRTRHLEGLYEP